MPLGRKHLRRNRDAPTGENWPLQRTTSNLDRPRREVKLLIQMTKMSMKSHQKAGLGSFSG
jgi:hypothetical protein